MTPEQIELAQRLVKHPAFKWSAGMRAIDKDGHRWRILANIGCPGHHAQGEEHAGYTSGWETIADLLGAVPDLTDPATVGCLLALAREVLGDSRLCVAPVLYTWQWTIFPGDHPLAPTEGEALALAILGAA